MATGHQNSADDLAQGAKTGVKAAKEVKRVASVVTNATSGNLVGAAAEAAKSETVRMVAIILLVVMAFVFFCAVFIFPMTLYEALTELVEQWKVDFYSGTNGRVVSFFRATGNLIVNLVNRIIPNGDSESTDTASEADANITTSKGDLNIVYARKIQAAKDKVTARQKTIIEKINSEAQNGQIGSIMYGRFITQFGSANTEYDVQYDPYSGDIVSAKVNIFDGTQLIANNRTITDMTALQLVCLHTAQKGGDLANIKLSAFVKWLGYNGADNRKITFPLGDNDNINFSMKSWTGGFIPQYLEDEAAMRGRVEAQENGRFEEKNRSAATMTERYEKEYGASIVDMLIQVDCPNLYSIAPSITEELKEGAGIATKWVKDYSRPIYGQAGGDIYPAYLRDQKPANYYTQWYQQGYRYVSGVYCEGRYGNFLYARAGWYVTTVNGQPSLVRSSNNPKPLRPIVDYEMKEVEYTYDITYIHIKYTVPVTVRCRDLDGLLQMAGLWEGPLPWDNVPEQPEDDGTVILTQEDRRAA